MLWQRHVDLEVVVVDDGFTDDTAQVVAGLGDPRVRRVHHHTPQGVSAARNRGIAEADGGWVTFVDDDLWALEKLARQLQATRDAGRAWAYASAVSVDGALRIVSGTRLHLRSGSPSCSRGTTPCRRAVPTWSCSRTFWQRRPVRHPAVQHRGLGDVDPARQGRPTGRGS